MELDAKAIAESLKNGTISMKQFKGMAECAFDAGDSYEQRVMMLASERAGLRYENAFNAIADRY